MTMQTATITETQKPKSLRGFASMTPERRREIASLGGRSVPAANRSFSIDSELASRAGRKGGSVTGVRKA